MFVFVTNAKNPNKAERNGLMMPLYENFIMWVHTIFIKEFMLIMLHLLYE